MLMFKVKSVIIFLLLNLIISTIALAQDESAECSFEAPDSSIIELGEAQFSDCAAGLLAYGSNYELDEVYGYWDEYYVYVSGDGEVYWLDENDEWVHWGTTSTTVEAEEERAA